jgi:O-antigen/teichoic acid export membrane protein
MQLKPLNRRKLPVDFLILLAAQVLIQAVTALTGIIIARTFSPVQYAAYTLAFTGLNIATILSDFGLSQYLSRELPLVAEPQRLNLWLRVIRLRLALSFAAFLLILAITWLWSGAGDPFFALIAGLTLFPSTIAILATSGLNASGKTARSAALNSFAGLLNAAFLLGALWLWREVALVLAAGLIATTVNAVILSFTAKQKLSSPDKPYIITEDEYTKNNTNSSVKNMLKFGIAFLWINLASLIFQYADIYLVSALVTEEQLGYYGAAMRLTGLITVMATVWGIAALPRLSKLYAENKPLEKALANRWTLILTGFGFLQAILLIPLADPVVKILLGDSYVSAAPLVIILGWYTAAIFAGTVVVNRLIVQGKQKRVAIVLTVSGVITILLAVILMLGFNLGITGMAIAKAVGAWILTIGYFVVLK